MDSTRGNLSPMKLIKGGDIPEWMLLEVLMRLPAKILFKFKIVSKQWLSMISDPSFARMYVARTSPLPHSQPWILISSFVNKATTEHFFTEKLPLHGCSLGINCLDLLILPPARQVDGFDYIVVGISNGLVLYGPRAETGLKFQIYSYGICNPVTGQWITLLPHKRRFEFVITGFVTQVEDNILASYRVVRLDAANRIRSRAAERFEVYFSEMRKWVDFDVYVNQYIYFYKWKNPVVLDKILHWMITRHRILAYDPYNKPDSIRLISLPGVSGVSYEGNKIDIDNILFDEHQGHLRYLELDGRPNELSRNLSIWVLSGYDSGKWCMQHKVGIDDIQCDGKLSIFPVPLSFHPFDSKVVYMINHEALFSYDVKTRKLKIMDDSSKSYHLQLLYCRSYFLFVVPPWPVSFHPSSL